jgi:hypothetical protein
MDRVLTDELVQARKHYPCDASYWWDRSGYGLNDCETSEQRLIVEAAEADNWRILPGQKYRKVTGIFEGRMTTYRARPGMQSVIEQLGLTDE